MKCCGSWGSSPGAAEIESGRAKTKMKTYLAILLLTTLGLKADIEFSGYFTMGMLSISGMRESIRKGLQEPLRKTSRSLTSRAGAGWEGS